MIVRLALDLPDDARCVRIARLLGRTLLEYLQVQPVAAEDIEFVLGELCTNVVRHAEGEDGRFTVTLEYYADYISVTVEDKGLGFEFHEVPDVGSVRPDFGGEVRIGGFGMGLIKAFSDKLEFRRTDPRGTTVRAEKALVYKSAPAHEIARELDGQGGAGGLRISVS